MPMKANVITSHVVYEVKTDEAGVRTLKAIIYPHSNRDMMKDELRKYSATAQYDIVRLMLSIKVLLPFNLGLVFINGAYMQSGPIRRQICVRPPK